MEMESLINQIPKATRTKKGHAWCVEVVQIITASPWETRKNLVKEMKRRGLICKTSTYTDCVFVENILTKISSSFSREHL